MEEEKDDVRVRIYRLRHSFKRNDSFLLYLCEWFSLILQIFSIPCWRGLCLIPKKEGNKALLNRVTERWLFTILLMQLLILSVGVSSNFPHWIFRSIAIWFLLDSMAATFRDLFLSPKLHGFIKTGSPQRWLLFTLLAIVEVILSFAIIILYHKNYDNSATGINDWKAAIFISAKTFITLGYDDSIIHLKTYWITLGEIWFFLLFLALKLPLAISIIRIEPPR
jgi:hypothetical protein